MQILIQITPELIIFQVYVIQEVIIKVMDTTAWKVSVFGVILVLVFPYSDWTQTRINLNTNTFYTVYNVLNWVYMK